MAEVSDSDVDAIVLCWARHPMGFQARISNTRPNKAFKAALQRGLVLRVAEPTRPALYILSFDGLARLDQLQADEERELERDAAASKRQEAAD